jgi:hypothetical protein
MQQAFAHRRGVWKVGPPVKMEVQPAGSQPQCVDGRAIALMAACSGCQHDLAAIVILRIEYRVALRSVGQAHPVRDDVTGSSFPSMIASSSSGISPCMGLAHLECQPLSNASPSEIHG